MTETRPVTARSVAGCMLALFGTATMVQWGLNNPLGKTTYKITQCVAAIFGSIYAYKRWGYCQSLDNRPVAPVVPQSPFRITMTEQQMLTAFARRIEKEPVDLIGLRKGSGDDLQLFLAKHYIDWVNDNLDRVGHDDHADTKVEGTDQFRKDLIGQRLRFCLPEEFVANPVQLSKPDPVEVQHGFAIVPPHQAEEALVNFVRNYVLAAATESDDSSSSSDTAVDHTPTIAYLTAELKRYLTQAQGTPIQSVLQAYSMEIGNDEFHIRPASPYGAAHVSLAYEGSSFVIRLFTKVPFKDATGRLNREIKGVPKNTIATGQFLTQAIVPHQQSMDESIRSTSIHSFLYSLEPLI